MRRSSPISRMDRESRIHDTLEIMLQDKSSTPCKLPLEYLRKITNDFSDKRLLGEGGFGKVYKPKIADFGLSKLFIDKKTHTCATTLFGSLGYMAPEYICNRWVTTKADIYSLGVIIIEIITGGKIDLFNFDIATSRRDFVEPVLQNRRNRLEAAPRCASLDTDYHQIEICLEIGISCIMFDPKERPAIGRIIEILNKWENTSCYVNDVERPAAVKISEPKELLEITPIRLHFSFDPDQRVICLVKLINKTDDNVVFHFGVTEAENVYHIEPNTGLLLPWSFHFGVTEAENVYHIEPNTGLLLPWSTFNVDVTMEMKDESPSSVGDEFLVQSVTMQGYNAISKPITTDMFNNMPKNMVHKVKLKVVYVPSLPRIMSELVTIESLVAALGNSPVAQHRMILGESLYRLVDQLEHDQADKVTGMLLELDLTEVLNLIESPEALKARVAEAMKTLCIDQLKQSMYPLVDQLEHEHARRSLKCFWRWITLKFFS
ncbi:hypothetical protein ACP4OV_030644 [Aristida adscensionis]